MKKMTGLAMLLLASALGACGTQGGNEAAGNTSAMDMNMGANGAMAMSGPFAESEQRMDREMMAAVGSDVGQTWLRKMIVHHQGAIEMSQVVLAQNPSPAAAKMARDTIAMQGAENEQLRAMLNQAAPDPRSAEPYKASMMDMHAKMMAASGADISETFFRKMLEHHRGAVTMSDVALANGVTGALRSQIEKTRATQVREIAMVEAILRGEPMPAATSAAATATTNAAPKATQAAAPARPAPVRAAPAPATAEPSAPPAAPANAAACAPEHRAMGHC